MHTINGREKKLVAIIIAISLMGLGAYTGHTNVDESSPIPNNLPTILDPQYFPFYIKQAHAQSISFINIDLTGTLNEFDFPFGIDCGAQEDNFVYVTIFDQGLLAKIDKNTKQVVELINDPELNPDGSPISSGQHFYAIARASNGNLFVNELDNGKAWRFNPSASAETAWDRIPLVREIVHPNVTYGFPDFPTTYSVSPNILTVDESFAEIGLVGYTFFIPSLGGVAFTNNFVWITLTYSIDFDDAANSIGIDDQSFSGVVRVDPTTLDVKRFNIPGAGDLASLNVDSTDETVLWIADRTGDKIYKFDTDQTLGVSETDTTAIVEEISLPAGSVPNHIDTNSDSIFVALNKPNLGEPLNSEIAQISRSDVTNVNIIDTTAEVTNSGTFTVFVQEDEAGDLVVWTDQSGHVGTVDLLSGVKTVENTETTSGNHFGCVPFDGEFWFAGQGSAHVGIQPNSKFSVGGLKRPSGHGSSDPVARSNSSPFGETDANPPVIGQVITSPGSLKISAQITDDVGVKDANVIISKKAYEMQPHNGNPLWWDVTVPSEDLPSGEVFFKIVARDFGLNTATYEGSAESSGSTGGSQQGPMFVTTPLAEGIHNSAYSIVGSGLTQDSKTMSLQVTIKNTSTEPLKNIRIMLSPELKGKFLLSDYAIKSIEPNSEYVITLKLNGRPNVDVTGEPIPYSGRIFISVDNKSPYILELSGAIPNESAALQSLFMKNIASKGEQRYKSFVKPEERISQAEYDVKLGSGESVIKSTSDELIITNTGDKPLKNLRIMTSSSADHFIPELKNIELIPAGSFIKVKLISKIDDNSAITKDLSGEVIIAPENGVPVTVPVSISKRLQEDKNTMYEIQTISGNNEISNTADGIIIRNSSEETINNVRLILPQQLARMFSLSEDSFKSIEPNSERIVHIQQRGTPDSNVKQILNDYRGDLIIVSSDGMKKVVPINIVWKGISSEHFVINARDSAEELTKAAQVINFLERSYPEASKLVGKTDAKTVIYMTSSLDELKRLTSALYPSSYAYAEDVGFVWSNSEDVNMLALKQFTYRTIVQNYGTYWTNQKISADKGNWLLEGISDYVTAHIAGEKGMIRNDLEAFIAEPTSFEYYGASTLSQHGASYTLFKFLADKYGDTIIDKMLNNLGSTMINSNRCGTLEQCVLVKGVYDINGMNMDDKRHEISFATIMQEWRQYIQDEYGITFSN